MAPTDLKEKMKEYLEKRFDGKASAVFMDRMAKIIDGMPDDAAAMDQGLNNIRIAVKLLFDDNLSEDVHEELRLMAKYSDRIT